MKVDGHDRAEIASAIRAALAQDDRPTLIICRTHIAHGAPNLQDTAAAHGSPLGENEIRAVKEAMGFPPDEQFRIDPSVYEFFTVAMERGRSANNEWKGRLVAADSASRDLWDRLHATTPVTLDGPTFPVGEKLATRVSSGKLFGEIAEKVPGFIGGAADLAASTRTVIDEDRLFSKDDPSVRDIPFGVREHAMGTIVNGMAVHGGLRPYGATFFVFSDYMRPAVRLSALMNAPSIWVWTHDSVFLGEDGPTHQPIEHLASLRAMPGLWVIRPADANEVTQAWEIALNRTDGPVALVLTRQGVPTLEKVPGAVAKGGYVIRPGADVTLIATGSEVGTTLQAAEMLGTHGLDARVVSLPCWELFLQQPLAYQHDVLGTAPRVSIEAASTFGWERLVGDGLKIGIDRFGASAPDSVIAEHLGFTADAIATRVRSHLGK
jgi:transketolase